MSGLLENLKSMYAHDVTVLAGIENGSIRGIPLTQGKIALVDAEDYDRFCNCKWKAEKKRSTFYAARCVRNKTFNGTIYMHREIIGLINKDGIKCDHINHNGLDNRRLNLRRAYGSTNQINHLMRKDNTSGYRGVNWSNWWGKWQARAYVKGKCIFCGWHTDPISAAKAYDKAAAKYYGEAAILNFPQKG